MPSRSWSLLVCPFPILWLSIFGTTAQADGDSSKTCFSRPSDRWALNSLGQNPCEVAERLVSVCTGECEHLPSSYLIGMSFGILVQSLWTSVTTSGPTPEQSNDCACSTVLYSLASQCLLCQDKDIPMYVTYTPGFIGFRSLTTAAGLCGNKIVMRLVLGESAIVAISAPVA